MADDLNAHDILDTAEQATRDAFALAHRALNAGLPAPIYISAGTYNGSDTVLDFGHRHGPEAQRVVAWMRATCSGVADTVEQDAVSKHGYVKIEGRSGAVTVKAAVEVASVGVATVSERTVSVSSWRLDWTGDDEEDVAQGEVSAA